VPINCLTPRPRGRILSTATVEDRGERPMSDIETDANGIETIVTEDGRIMRAAGLVDSYARQVLCSTDEMRPSSRPSFSNQLTSTLASGFL